MNQIVLNLLLAITVFFLGASSFAVSVKKLEGDPLQFCTSQTNFRDHSVVGTACEHFDTYQSTYYFYDFIEARSKRIQLPKEAFNINFMLVQNEPALIYINNNKLFAIKASTSDNPKVIYEGGNRLSGYRLLNSSRYLQFSVMSNSLEYRKLLDTQTLETINHPAFLLAESVCFFENYNEQLPVLLTATNRKHVNEAFSSLQQGMALTVEGDAYVFDLHTSEFIPTTIQLNPETKFEDISRDLRECAFSHDPKSKAATHVVMKSKKKRLVFKLHYNSKKYSLEQLNTQFNYIRSVVNGLVFDMMDNGLVKAFDLINGVTIWHEGHVGGPYTNFQVTNGATYYVNLAGPGLKKISFDSEKGYHDVGFVGDMDEEMRSITFLNSAHRKFNNGSIYPFIQSEDRLFLYKQSMSETDYEENLKVYVYDPVSEESKYIPSLLDNDPQGAVFYDYVMNLRDVGTKISTDEYLMVGGDSNSMHIYHYNFANNAVEKIAEAAGNPRLFRDYNYNIYGHHVLFRDKNGELFVAVY